ncbi:MAG: LytTR family DNA-binding domain-containing protein [Bacteroidota bacterium]
MTQISCIVIDDEQPARELLANFISKVPNLRLIEEMKSPMLALDHIHQGSVDLIFMDIQMPDITGTNFLKTVRTVPPVIFTTAYSEYALEGFDLDVVDYLLKPFSFERFLQSVNKATQLIKGSASEMDQQVVTVHADHRVYRVPSRNILYIESMREYMAYHTADGGRIMALQRMKQLDEHLPELFVRTHRSYIINLEHVSYLEGNSLIVRDKRIPIGGNYKSSVVEKFGLGIQQED